MKYVFGPVPSKRLGQSLGIDTIPLKTCNWNCVYCQLGRTVPMTNERREYFPIGEIFAEVSATITNKKPNEIDWVTFVGSGEPTLHSGLGKLIRGVKALTDLPVAVITNGALLYLPEVRDELSAADAILPSLDAGSSKLYRKINRHHPETTFERLLDGLVRFREVYLGKLWVEVMLLRDINDTETALREIAAALNRIQPDEVHVVLPTRPPVETWVKHPDDEGLLRARAIFGDIAHVVHPTSGMFDFKSEEFLTDDVIEIITRHPIREDELINNLNQFSLEKVAITFGALKSCDRVQIIERYGVRFWSATSARYPSNEQSQRTQPRDHNQQKSL